MGNLEVDLSGAAETDRELGAIGRENDQETAEQSWETFPLVKQAEKDIEDHLPGGEAL